MSAIPWWISILSGPIPYAGDLQVKQANGLPANDIFFEKRYLRNHNHPHQRGTSTVCIVKRHVFPRDNQVHALATRPLKHGQKRGTVLTMSKLTPNEIVQFKALHHGSLVGAATKSLRFVPGMYHFILLTYTNKA